MSSGFEEAFGCGGKVLLGPDGADDEGLWGGGEGYEFQTRAGRAIKALRHYGDASAGFNGGGQAGGAVMFLNDFQPGFGRSKNFVQQFVVVGVFSAAKDDERFSRRL